MRTTICARPRRHGQHRSNLEDSATARMTQINIDASRLEGVDLSKVPNQKIAFKKMSGPN